MKILFLSYHFYPDLSAGSFRNTALADALKAQSSKFTQVDILKTFPSRYTGFKVGAIEKEECEGFSIHRISVRKHVNGMLDQSRAFLQYAGKAIELSKSKKY